MNWRIERPYVRQNNKTKEQKSKNQLVIRGQKGKMFLDNIIRFISENNSKENMLINSKASQIFYNP